MSEGDISEREKSKQSWSIATELTALKRSLDNPLTEEKRQQALEEMARLRKETLSLGCEPVLEELRERYGDVLEEVLSTKPNLLAENITSVLDEGLKGRLKGDQTVGQVRSMIFSARDISGPAIEDGLVSISFAMGIVTAWQQEAAGSSQTVEKI